MEEVVLARAVRLSRLQQLLYHNPRGLSTAEMAGHCGVSRRTIERDLHAFEDLGLPLWEKDGRYGILEGYFLPPVRFSLHEAGALFLASRLLGRYSDERNPHVVNALTKLAGVLPEAIAPHVQRTVSELAARTENAGFTKVFETLMLGWATQRRVRIWYQSAGSENVHDYVFAPYAIEPIGGGNATYAIGYADWFKGVRTFKLERISRAELLEDKFEFPEAFDLPSQLESSWGIIWGDAVELRLRFTARVTRRVKETIWHKSQVIEDQSDGGCHLTLRLGSLLEITPWIRGWGPDCEVLAPQSLRADMAAWAKETAGLYRGEG